MASAGGKASAGVRADETTFQGGAAAHGAFPGAGEKAVGAISEAAAVFDRGK